MIIHNKNFRIAAQELTSSFQRVKGLMFSRKLSPEKGLLFIFDQPRQIDIHMLFVFQSIDAVWTDKKGNVLLVKRNIKPFTPFVMGAEASYLLETAAFATSSLKTGDKVKFKRV